MIRFLLTHDLDTMTKYANERIAQGLPLAGVIFVRDTLPIAKVIDDLMAILGASEASEWENRTDFLPLSPHVAEAAESKNHQSVL